MFLKYSYWKAWLGTTASQGRKFQFTFGGWVSGPSVVRISTRKRGGANRHRVSYGRGLGAQPPVGSRGGAPGGRLGGRSPPENFWEK